MMNLLISISSACTLVAVRGGKKLWGRKNHTYSMDTYGLTRTAQFKQIRLPLNPDEHIINMLLGSDYALVLTSQNRYFICGINCLGQFGIGDRMYINSFEPASPSISSMLLPGEMISDCAGNCFSTYLVTSFGRVFATGGNADGQLGVGDCNGRKMFTLVEGGLSGEHVTRVIPGLTCTIAFTLSGHIFICGALGVDFGALFKLFILPKTFGESERVVDCALGDRHIIMSTSENRLLGFGCNKNGELGLGHFDNLLECAFLPPLVLNAGEDISQLAAGAMNTLVLLSSGRLFGCGYLYQCSNPLAPITKQAHLTLLEAPPSMSDRIIQVRAYGSYSLAVTAKGWFLNCGVSADVYSRDAMRLHGATIPYLAEPIAQLAHPAMYILPDEPERDPGMFIPAPTMPLTLSRDPQGLSIDDLPNEVLQHVFELPCIDLRMMLKLMCVSKRFHTIILENCRQYRMMTLDPEVFMLRNDSATFSMVASNIRHIYRSFLTDEERHAFCSQLLECMPRRLHSDLALTQLFNLS